MNDAALLEKAQIAQAKGAKVELVGRWVWAQFEQRPPTEVRSALKDAGYHWNAQRGLWQFAGVPCRHSPAGDAAIKAKYGAVELEEVAAWTARREAFGCALDVR